MATVLVAFQGEPMCFVHVLLYALDLEERGQPVSLIIEGAATKLVKELNDPEKPFAKLYQQVRDAGLIECVCEACSAKMGALESAKEQMLPINGELKGHPSLARFIEAGDTILTF